MPTQVDKGALVGLQKPWASWCFCHHSLVVVRLFVWLCCPKTRVKRCAHRNSLSQKLLSKGLNCFPGGPSLTKAMTFSLVFARPAAEPCATGCLWRHWKFMLELLHWCSWWQLFHSLVLLCEDLCRTPGLGLALPNQGPLNSKKRYTGTDRCVSPFSQRHISPIVQSLVKWQPCSKLVAARPSTWQTA